MKRYVVEYANDRVNGIPARHPGREKVSRIVTLHKRGMITATEAVKLIAGIDFSTEFPVAETKDYKVYFSDNRYFVEYINEMQPIIHSYATREGVFEAIYYHFN